SNTGTTNIVYGIHNDLATSANVQITNNTVTIHGGGSTQQIIAIYNQAGSTPAGNSVEINNNIIQNCTYPTATSGSFYAIQNAGTAEFVKINGNTISDFINFPGTGTVYMIFNSASLNTINVEINNNTINNIVRTSTTGDLTYIISSGTAASVTLNNNNVFDISKSGTSAFRIYTNTLSPLIENYSGNNFYNITNNGSGITAGIYSSTTASCVSNFSNNKIYNINTSSSTSTYGIYKTIGTYTVQKNKIYDINAISGEVVGIYTGTGSATVSNNLIANLDVAESTGAAVVSGIRGATGTILNVYYNTINLNATSTTALAFGTSGIFISGTTSPTLDIRNNIIINKSTPNGTGITAAFRRSSTDFNAISAACNNNLYYAGIPSNNNVIFYDGTNIYPTILDYKTLVAPREDLSATENVSFVSMVGSSVDFLKVNPTTPSITESGAQSLTGLTDDHFTANIRTGYPLAGQVNGGGTAPDMGAIESDNTPRLIIDYGISAFNSPVAGNCYGTNSDIIVVLNNYSVSTVDLAVDNVTINVTATDPSNIVTNFSILVNSGTLAGGSTMPVTISSVYDMSAVGTYLYTAKTSSPADATASNDSLVPAYQFTIDNGNVSVNNNSVCSGSSLELILTGSTGTIQWQSSIDNGATWINETGLGSTSSTYNTTAPNVDVLYRTLTCGTLISDTAMVLVTYIAPPVSSNISRCGTGPVTLSATASGPISWFDAATGGSLLANGNTYTTTVAATTNFYAQAADNNTTIGSVGPLNNTIGTTSSTSSTFYYQIFDVLNSGGLTIMSLDIIPNVATGSAYTINIENNSGAVIGSFPGTTSVAAGNTQTVTLNQFVAPGTGYRIRFSQSISCFRNTTGAVYPYTVPGEISITGSNFSNVAYYYFFYNVVFQSGCTSERTTVEVTVTPAPAITLTASATEICENDTVDLTVSSTNNDYAYNWTPTTGLITTTGANIQAVPLTATTYTVNAEDLNTGCVISDAVTIDVNPAPLTLASSTLPEICVGDSTQLDANANIPTPQFIGINNFQNSTTGYPAPYGNFYWGAKHQMLITAAEMTAYGYVAGPLTSLAFDIINVNSCPSLDDFTIAIGHTSAVAMTTYESGLTSVFSAASYTPVNGINTHNFSNPFVWDGVSNIIVETCFNNSSYLSSGNATFKQTSTSYISVRRNNSDNATVCANTTGTTNSSTRPDMRFGQNIVITYNWSPSTGLSDPTVANPFASPLITTNYEVSVTNSYSGCSAMSAVTIIVNDLPEVDLTVTDNICNGGSIGSINSTITNTIPGALTYSWSHDVNETGSSVSGLAAGIYVLEVTSDKGCVGIAQDTVTEPALMVNTITTVNVVCFGADNGEAEITSTTGGTSPHSYIWNNDPTLNSSIISSLTPGIHVVEVTDDNGCTKLDTVTITEPDQIVITTSTSDLLCNGDNSGQAIAQAIGGTGVITYNWSNGIQNDTISGLSAGQYSITAMDDNNCIETQIVTVTEPNAFVFSPSITDESCLGANDGTATVNVTGGTGFYNLTWNTNPVQTGSAASGLAAGTYIFTVVDNDGCSDSETITIDNGNTEPIADFSYNSAGTSIDFINNSTGATSWIWVFGDNSSLSNAQNPTHSYATSGSYTVTLIANSVCGSDTISQVIMVTGINDLKNAYTLDVFPNPTSDVFTVKFDSDQSNNFNIRLVDMQGRVLENDNLNQFSGIYQKTFDIRNYASGVYTMQIVTDKGVITRRIVLNK
ncbi:MAG: T9SS type A sorting domain-containing protein, partial [Bacteroidota bacterium]|nr:T9SS type A sorting domain-containing protein [Bacteroidota bacterium]